MNSSPVKRNLLEFGKLFPAEQKLLDEIDTGLDVVIGGGQLPPEGAPEDRKIRASFLRYLILGGCKKMQRRVHEKGVRVEGAFVFADGSEGAETQGLDLEGCRIPRDIGLRNCRFDAPLLLRSAQIETLHLAGSYLPHLNANKLVARGSVFLRGVRVSGEANFVGSKIGSNLECDGATFDGSSGRALNMDGAEVNGIFFLRDEAKISGVLDRRKYSYH